MVNLGKVGYTVFLFVLLYITKELSGFECAVLAGFAMIICAIEEKDNGKAAD